MTVCVQTKPSCHHWHHIASKERSCPLSFRPSARGAGTDLQGGEGGKNSMPQKLLVLVTLLALGGGGSSARGADTKELEHVLDQWALAWSSGDVERLLPLFTDGVDYEDVPFVAASHGRDALRDIATGTFAAFADLKFELKSRFVAADGKSGAIEWIWRGRQTQDFPGLPAANKPFEVRGTTIVEVTDGKISRNPAYWDLATYMKQVGVPELLQFSFSLT